MNRLQAELLEEIFNGTPEGAWRDELLDQARRFYPEQQDATAGQAFVKSILQLDKEMAKEAMEAFKKYYAEPLREKLRESETAEKVQELIDAAELGEYGDVAQEDPEDFVADLIESDEIQDEIDEQVDNKIQSELSQNLFRPDVVRDAMRAITAEPLAEKDPSEKEIIAVLKEVSEACKDAVPPVVFEEIKERIELVSNALLEQSDIAEIKEKLHIELARPRLIDYANEVKQRIVLYEEQQAQARLGNAAQQGNQPVMGPEEEGVEVVRREEFTPGQLQRTLSDKAMETIGRAAELQALRAIKSDPENFKTARELAEPSLEKTWRRAAGIAEKFVEEMITGIRVRDGMGFQRERDTQARRDAPATQYLQIESGGLEESAERKGKGKRMAPLDSSDDDKREERGGSSEEVGDGVTKEELDAISRMEKKSFPLRGVPETSGRASGSVGDMESSSELQLDDDAQAAINKHYKDGQYTLAGELPVYSKVRPTVTVFPFHDKGGMTLFALPPENGVGKTVIYALNDEKLKESRFTKRQRDSIGGYVKENKKLPFTTHIELGRQAPSQSADKPGPPKKTRTK